MVLAGSALVAVRTGPSGIADDDRARLDHLLARPAGDVAGVLADASAIRDPVLREVGVETWLRENLRSLDRAGAVRVCQSLGGVATDVCLRKVDSPHLRERPAR